MASASYSLTTLSKVLAFYTLTTLNDGTKDIPKKSFRGSSKYFLNLFRGSAPRGAASLPCHTKELGENTATAVLLYHRSAEFASRLVQGQDRIHGYWATRASHRLATESDLKWLHGKLAVGAHAADQRPTPMGYVSIISAIIMDQSLADEEQVAEFERISTDMGISYGHGFELSANRKRNQDMIVDRDYQHPATMSQAYIDNLLHAHGGYKPFDFDVACLVADETHLTITEVLESHYYVLSTTSITAGSCSLELDGLVQALRLLPSACKDDHQVLSGWTSVSNPLPSQNTASVPAASTSLVLPRAKTSATDPLTPSNT